MFRVKMGSAGQLPKGFPEGMLTGLTKSEYESLTKNKLLKECFEEVQLVAEYPPTEEAPLQSPST